MTSSRTVTIYSVFSRTPIVYFYRNVLLALWWSKVIKNSLFWCKATFCHAYSLSECNGVNKHCYSDVNILSLRWFEHNFSQIVLTKVLHLINITCLSSQRQYWGSNKKSLHYSGYELEDDSECLIQGDIMITSSCSKLSKAASEFVRRILSCLKMACHD